MTCRYTLKYLCGENERVLNDSCENSEVLLKTAELPSRRTVTITAKQDICLLEYKEYDLPFADMGANAEDLYFINGYQSWTDSHEKYLSETEHNLKKIPKALVSAFSFESYGDYKFYDYDKSRFHGYDVFYKTGENGLFIGSMNYNNAYLIIEVERKSGAITLKSDIKRKYLKAGESFTICDYIYNNDYKLGLIDFQNHFGKKNIKKIFGYTSWYNYYQDINEEILLRDLAGLDDRFNLFQIDDGYETFVGDWLSVSKEKFPNGLSPIVQAAHKKGYLAGIWLAPFVAEEKSRLFEEKKEWFKRDKNGEFIKCGSNWSGFYALDLENREAREYIKGCLKVYADMGFDFFKLDFLYAANLPDYENKTRCEAARDAYSLLREALPEKLILGCGATLINCANLFDYLRIGPDVSLKFDDVFYMRPMHRERISTKVTLQNTVFRHFTDNYLFGNDPDVFLLRDDNISLSPAQRKALITLNSLFGSVMMTSDNIAEYSAEKKAELTAALDLFQNAKVTEYRKNGKVITINYLLDNETKQIKYHTGKGVLI